MPAPAGIEPHPREQLGIRREVPQRLVQVAEVADLLEGARVRLQIAVDEARVLAGARQLAEPAPDRRQQPEDHSRRAPAYTATSWSTVCSLEKPRVTCSRAAWPNR